MCIIIEIRDTGVCLEKMQKRLFKWYSKHEKRSNSRTEMFQLNRGMKSNKT